ncbi:MAG: glycosyl transferase [Halobacteriovoraceae bacterium]|nr:glycosyl transferase [Halobacteriovoraceae bacterium]|tara:strand:+ start:111557 stop:112405 length:849 start_codon:yes stop_codon:yes gene_type:complete
MSLVSVIIPTYNRIETLGRAVDSVLNQTYQNLECLIVDDASTDGTDHFVIERYSNDPRVKLVSLTENQGVSHARNIGFSHAQGDYIALLDSDDEWLKHKLEKQIHWAKNNPHHPLIHGEEIWIRNGKRVNPKFKHKKEGGKIFQRCLGLCLISPSAALMTRELYQEMNGFREDFIVCEDYELWLRVTHKYEVGFIEEPILNKYGGHDDQLSARYKAMDYWRVKAMHEIYDHPDFNLNESESQALKEMILEKARILEMGYLKHGNLENLSYVRSILTTFSELP